MRSFSDLIKSDAFRGSVLGPSVSISNTFDQTFSIRFNSKDVVLEAKYLGKIDPWLSSMCLLIENKSLSEVQDLNFKNWDEYFKLDTSYWELRSEDCNEVFNRSLELLKAAINLYLGRTDLYEIKSSLLCRCFGVREHEIIQMIDDNPDITIKEISEKTKAMMGCRSCVSEITQLLPNVSKPRAQYFFKDKTISEWILLIDEVLHRFSFAKDWGMEISHMENNIVEINFSKVVSQKEKEEVNKKLQLFLGGAVDPDLVFLLIRN